MENKSRKTESYVLKLHELVKVFDRKRVVDHFTMNLRRGEILGLLGPNGAGKTTTIRMIMNIIAPDSGTIEILGETFNETLKNHIGYLPEERGLYRKMKVTETLEFFGQLKGLTKEQITSRGRDLLEEFDLTAYADRKVEELSKGMAQKLQFITTILHAPDLLILDEPFSGLDPVNIELVKDIILAKKKEGFSIIFSTHLMDYAEKIVDSVVMIDQGKKVLDGTLKEIKGQLDTRLIKVQYHGDGQFVADLPMVSRVKDYGNQMEIHLKDMSEKNVLLRELSARLDLIGFQVTEPSLNQVFIDKVNEGR